jgi:hypothetical protein
MERLLHLLAEAQVERVVLESRSTRLKAADDALVDVMRVRQAIPAALRVMSEDPEAEPLLWAADAVAGAVRMVAASGSDEHFAVLAARIELIELGL